MTLSSIGFRQGWRSAWTLLGALTKGTPIAVGKMILFTLLLPVALTAFVANAGGDDRLLTWVQRRF